MGTVTIVPTNFYRKLPKYLSSKKKFTLFCSMTLISFTTKNQIDFWKELLFLVPSNFETVPLGLSY